MSRRIERAPVARPRVSRQPLAGPNATRPAPRPSIFEVSRPAQLDLTGVRRAQLHVPGAGTAALFTVRRPERADVMEFVLAGDLASRVQRASLTIDPGRKGAAEDLALAPARLPGFSAFERGGRAVETGPARCLGAGVQVHALRALAGPAAELRCTLNLELEGGSTNRAALGFAIASRELAPARVP